MAVSIYTRDHNGITAYQIDQFTHVDVILRWNDIGAWSIAAPVTDASLALAQPGMAAVIQGDGWSMSGPVTSIERDRGSNNGEAQDVVVISGVSDNTALWERVCYPCLPNGTPPTLFAAADHDDRSGPGESVMIEYVQANMGGGDWSSGLYSDRIMPGLTIAADQGRGNSVSFSARFDVLGSLLQQIAVAAGGLGFDIIDQVFAISEPRDLSALAVFSAEIGNLVAYQYSLASPTATHVIVGGGDQDVNRTFVRGGNDPAASLWRRIEVFSDQRGTTDPTQLTQTLTQNLIDDAAKTGLNLRPIDIPTLTFGIDYKLGDFVTVVVDGTEIVDVVRQVEITADQNGIIISPTLQSATSDGVASALTFFTALRKIQRRVSSLERTL